MTKHRAYPHMKAMTPDQPGQPKTEDTPKPMRELSYSRASTFLACKKAYKYKYQENLTPRIDIPQMKRGTLVDQGLCAAIVADQAGHDAATCLAIARDTATSFGRVWLASEAVQDHTKMAGEEWAEDMLELVTDSGLIAARAAKFIGLGADRWRTLIIPDPDDEARQRWQFGCQPKVVGDLDKPIDGIVHGNRDFKGHADWVARDLKTGHVWLIDFKVRKALQADEMLECDYQLPAYVAALRQMGVEVHGAAHLQIRAAVPKKPTLLKARKADDAPKMSRSSISTDWTTYRETVIDEGLDPNDYLDMREKLKPFDVFSTIYRSDEELDGVWRELAATRQDIVEWHANPDSSAPRRLHVMQCRGCMYAELCLAELRGHDAEHIRETHYTTEGRA